MAGVYLDLNMPYMSAPVRERHYALRNPSSTSTSKGSAANGKPVPVEWI